MFWEFLSRCFTSRWSHALCFAAPNGVSGDQSVRKNLWLDYIFHLWRDSKVYVCISIRWYSICNSMTGLHLWQDYTSTYIPKRPLSIAIINSGPNLHFMIQSSPPQPKKSRCYRLGVAPRDRISVVTRCPHIPQDNCSNQKWFGTGLVLGQWVYAVYYLDSLHFDTKTG